MRAVPVGFSMILLFYFFIFRTRKDLLRREQEKAFVYSLTSPSRASSSYEIASRSFRIDFYLALTLTMFEYRE